MSAANSDSIKSKQLGKTDIWIPPMGSGTWQWGEKRLWDYGITYQEGDINAAFHASIEAGIHFFDTSENYGDGKSERLLGKFIRSSGASPVVATKYDPHIWRRWGSCMRYALRRSLNRLHLSIVDLYQIHWPTSPMSIEKMAEVLAELIDAGLTRAVGVSNYSEEQMRLTNKILNQHGVPLASNQVKYSLLNRKVEKNGLLDACKELGVTMIAYSPLAQGMLTGKYSPDHYPTGVRAKYNNRERLARIQPLIQIMNEIGQSHVKKSPSQIALNWVMCKGAVPIPGAKNASQVVENAGALGWSLTDQEILLLDEASAGL